MQRQELDEALDQSLTMLRAGASIDECVARYPEHAAELRAQLGTAQVLLDARPHIEPQTVAREQGRMRLMDAVAERRASAEADPGLGLLAPFQAAFAGKFWRVPALAARAVPAALAVLILGGAAWGVSAATGNPNPGDWFVGSSSTQRVELRGTISAIDSNVLTIDTASGSALVRVTEQTKFEGERAAETTIAAFSVGDSVKVSAFRDEDGNLVARKVELEHAADADVAQGDDDQGDGGDINDADVGDAATPDNADDDGYEDREDNSTPGSDADGHEDDGDNLTPANEDVVHEDSANPEDGGVVEEEDHRGDEGARSTPQTDHGDEDGVEGEREPD